MQESLRRATNQVPQTNVTITPTTPQHTENKVNAKENTGGVWTGNTFNFPQAQKVEEAKEVLKELSALDSKATSGRPQWCTNVVMPSIPADKLADRTCDRYVTKPRTIGVNDFVIIAPPKGWYANYWVSDSSGVENQHEGLHAELTPGRDPAPYAGKQIATLWLKPGASPVTYEVTFYRE